MPGLAVTSPSSNPTHRVLSADTARGGEAHTAANTHSPAAALRSHKPDRSGLPFDVAAPGQASHQAASQSPASARRAACRKPPRRAGRPTNCWAAYSSSAVSTFERCLSRDVAGKRRIRQRIRVGFRRPTAQRLGEGKNLAGEKDGELDLVYQTALRRPPN